MVLCRHVLWALPDQPAALARWTALLAAGGALLLVEGHWHTGAGLTAAETEALLRGRRARARDVPARGPGVLGRPDHRRALPVDRLIGSEPR